MPWAPGSAGRYAQVVLPSPGWVIGSPAGTPSACVAIAVVSRSHGSPVASATGALAEVVETSSEVGAVPDVPAFAMVEATATTELALGATFVSPDEALSLPPHPAETPISSAVEQARAMYFGLGRMR